MHLRDPQKLAKLMAIQGVSARELAQVAGWKSHTYLQRLLRGEAKTLRPEPATKIAAFLDVPVESLFLTRMSSSSGYSVKPQRKPGRAA